MVLGEFYIDLWEILCWITWEWWVENGYEIIKLCLVLLCLVGFGRENALSLECLIGVFCTHFFWRSLICASENYRAEMNETNEDKDKNRGVFGILLKYKSLLLLFFNPVIWKYFPDPNSHLLDVSAQSFSVLSPPELKTDTEQRSATD